MEQKRARARAQPGLRMMRARTAGCSTSSCRKIVAPSLVIVTSPMLSTCGPRGPRVRASRGTGARCFAASARACAYGLRGIALAPHSFSVTHEHLVQANRAQAALDNVGQRHARRHCGRKGGAAARARWWRQAVAACVCGGRASWGAARARTILFADVRPAEPLAIDGQHGANETTGRPPVQMKLRTAMKQRASWRARA